MSQFENVTVLKKAKVATARPKPEKGVVDKIREVERGDFFHILYL